LLAVSLLAGGPLGCSKFNMVPRCEDLGPSISLALIPNSLVTRGHEIDRARVASIVSVSDLSEIKNGYNSRTCRGEIRLADGSDQFAATFRLDQAEGAQNWQSIACLDRGNPKFDRLVAEVQQAYIGGER
jgi:hypothetical protein